MPNLDRKPIVGRQQGDKVSLTVDIRRGPASPVMRSQWHNFWMRLAAECQRELKTEDEPKREQ